MKQKSVRRYSGKKVLISMALVAFLFLQGISGAVINAASGTWKSDSAGWWYSYSGGGYARNTWENIGGSWYYFGADGYMEYSGYRDGCWLNADGTWNSAYSGGRWASNATGWWYTDSSGWYPVNQWLKIDGKYYYFKGTGYMAANEWVGGYYFGNDGAWDSSKTESSGNTNTEAIPALYKSILRDAKKEITTDFSKRKTTYYSDYQPYQGDTHGYGYVLMDVNNDGTNELILCYENQVVYMGTIKNGKVKKLCGGMVRDRYYYLGDGLFYNFGSGGAAYSTITKYKYSSANNGLEIIEKYGYEEGTVYQYEKVNGVYKKGTQTVSEDFYFNLMNTSEDNAYKFNYNLISEYND